MRRRGEAFSAIGFGQERPMLESAPRPDWVLDQHSRVWFRRHGEYDGLMANF